MPREAPIDPILNPDIHDPEHVTLDNIETLLTEMEDRIVARLEEIIENKIATIDTGAEQIGSEKSSRNDIG